MEINKKCHLFLRDIYHYDIISCHYTILKRLGYDLTTIDTSNKLKRNTSIGLMFRENSNLVKIVRGITNSTLTNFLNDNHVKDDELILRQYDGVITTRRLSIKSNGIPVSFRTCFEAMIISIDRKSYIAWDGQKAIIKGVSYKYPNINNIYKKLVKLNFMSKESVFRNLQRIKDEILFSNDPFLYAIETGDNKYNVFFKQFGEIEVSKSMISIMDTDDIDKERYFDFYIRPFTESLVIEFQ